MNRRRKGNRSSKIKALRKEAYDRQRGKCYWCGTPMKTSTELNDPLRCTADHLIPLNEGGKTCRENIVAACSKCNHGRHPELTRKATMKRHHKVRLLGNDTQESPFAVLKGLIHD